MIRPILTLGNRSLEVGRIHTLTQGVHGLVAEALQFDRNEIVYLVGLLLQGKMHHEVFDGEQFTDFSIPNFIEQCDGVGFR